MRRGRTPDSSSSVSLATNLALSVAKDLSECPVPCHARLTCSDCLDLPGKCSWCEARQECFVFSVFTSRYQYGGCRDWTDEDVPVPYEVDNGVRPGGVPSSTGSGGQIASSGADGFNKCKRCESAWNCSTCLMQLGCGWCYNRENPTIGVCVRGDFAGPKKGEWLAVFSL